MTGQLQITIHNEPSAYCRFKVDFLPLTLPLRTTNIVLLMIHFSQETEMEDASQERDKNSFHLICVNFLPVPVATVVYIGG
jgi:hypothetical protein